MNLDILKNPMAEIYYLANTPTYIYRKIVDTFANIDLKDIPETEINTYEKSLKDSEKYLLYLFIYIKIKNEYKLNEDMYKDLKWHDEFISYCRSKQISTLSSSYCAGDDYTSSNTNREFVIDASF
jgi:hypothetical protein